MRSFAAGCLLALASTSCSARDRPDPSELARPDGKPVDDAGTMIEPTACGDFCGETFLHEVTDPPNLYFLVDRSGSMSTIMEGGKLTKYDTARKVLGTLLDVIGHRVRYGATIFPADTSGATCGPGLDLFDPTLGGLPSCDGELDPTLVEFLTRFGAYAPGGATPTSAALAELRPKLEDLTGTTYLVLLTDGAPNCNLDASCDADQCSLNIEGASVGKQACTTGFNCCDPNNTGPDGPAYCVDVDETEREIARLLDHGISTYVVGMPGAEPYASVLDRLAVAGGTARDGDVAYYAVADQAALEEALYSIGTGVALRCSIDLESPPDDPDKVNVYFDGELVPADPDDGWSWDGDARISVNGEACDRLKSGDVIDARAVFGCDTVVR